MPGRVRMRSRGRIATAVLLASVVLAAPCALAGLASEPAHAAKPRVHHVDCRAGGAAGDGSRARPLRDLSRASALRLRPGHRLLLRRGTKCVGPLVVRGSGSERRRAVVGAYGRGRAPRIEGRDADALVLRNTSHMVVRDLELTNPGDGSERRRGVYVVASRGVVRELTIRGLYVHDVGGDLSKAGDGSGGILVHAAGEPPVRFAGLRILRNRLERVGRSGISISGTRHAARPTADDPWPEASKRVVVRRNRLDLIDGDGIVPRGTVGARVERNVVSRGNLRGRSLVDPRGYVCNAGIWTFHANRTLIQHNEVFGMEFNGCDGTGFDIDYNQDATVIQFNLSHGNEGGFILLCGDDETRRGEVRFNLSVDDGSSINEAPCRIAEGRVGDLDGIRFFNNTIVARYPHVSAELVPLPILAGARGFEFRNNLLYGTRPGILPFPCGSDCSHNLFHRVGPSGREPLVADPAFRDPGRRGPGRLRLGRAFALRDGSPAIAAGVAMAGSPRRDYFGRPAPRGAAPSIGFHQPGR